MTLTDRCACMVESCWRRGICDFCINNHGGEKSTVSCALSAEAYAARKAHWDANHDEPQYPTNTALGILSKETMEVTRAAILALRDAQKAFAQCTADIWQLREEARQSGPDRAAVQAAAARLEGLRGNLELVIEQAQAAVLMSGAARAVVPASHR